jgi:putative ABC transport system permease protein
MDWRRYVRSHLPPLDVAAERESEIVEELALQLEAVYDRSRSAGADHDAAMRQVADEVPDWRALADVLVAVGAPAPPPPTGSEPHRAGRLAAFAGDGRFAIRSVLTWKAFPAAVLLLAVSMAAAVTVTAAVQSWSRPLPITESGRVALVWGTNRAIGQPRDVVSGPTFTDWRRLSTSFDGLAAFAESDLTIQRDGHAGIIDTLAVTPDFFRVAGIGAVVGREFVPDDAGVARIMISHELWQSQFGADPSVVGRTLGAIGLPHEVIGVLPAGFRLLSAPDAVTLLDPRSVEQEPRTHYFYWVIGRLRPAVSFAAAQRDLDGVMATLAARHPSMQGWSATVESLDAALAEPVRASLAVLAAIAGLVLVVGVGNTANLLASRALARTREIAIRAALGAPAGRIRRQWVIEGTIVSMSAAGIGSAMALGALAVLRTMTPQSAAIAGSAATVDLPRLEVQATTLPIVTGVAILIALVFGALPLGSASAIDLRGAAMTAPPLWTRGRQWLLAGQSTIATLLTAVSGLLLAAVLQLVATPPGFDPDRVAVMVVGGLADLDATARARYYARLVDTVRTAPGVIHAGINDYVPLTNEDDFEGIEIPGRVRDGAGTPREEWRRVSAGYFATLGIPLVRGRLPAESDDERAPSVVVVNAAMARKYWPDGDPIGARVRITNRAYGWSEVVGIVGDVREAGLDRPVKPMMFVPYHRDPRPVMGLFVKTAGDSRVTIEALRRAVWSVDPSRPILGEGVMSRIVSDSYAVQRSVLGIAGALAMLALLLIAGGTFAVVSLVTLGRQREMGVRIALGASQRDVMFAVLSRPCAWAAAGIASGLVAAWFGAAAIQAQLTGGRGLDVMTGAASVAVVAAVVAAACLGPAWRAMRTDPVITLRGEA